MSTLRKMCRKTQVYFSWVAEKTKGMTHGRESGFRNAANLYHGIRNPESWYLESGILLKESWIPLTTGIRNPSFTVKESGIQYLEFGIRNPEFKTVLVLICCRATCDIAAGAACDTVPIWEQKSPATEAMSVFTAGMPAELTRVQLRRHAGSKDCHVSCCRQRYVLICRRTIAGSTGGYVAGTSAAYENQALHRTICNDDFRRNTA